MKSNNSSKEKTKIFSPENKKIAKRLFSYLFESHKYKLFFIMFLVLISSAINVVSSLFLRVLIDDYILPMTKVQNPNFTPLIKMLLIFGLICLSGVISTIIYSIMMITISEKSMKEIRNRLFEHLERLPLSYFDSNSHGDIMSKFTNDVSALQQLLSNSLLGFFSSIVTIIAVILAMLFSSLMLSFVVAICLVILLIIMNNVTGKSSNYFLKQQESLGKQNGFIEEMIEGQKVVKIFSHEKNVLKDFEKLNDELAKNTMLANRYSLFLIPIVFNIGNLQYAFIAIAGGFFAVKGMFGVTIGTIAAFLQLSKAFSGPMRSISQQLNQLSLALAGAKRIFALLDEEGENYGGDYELVRIRKDKDALVECEEKTGIWAWKNTKNLNEPLIELKGNIVFDNVTFSYDGKNEVLKNISLRAKSGEKIAFVGETGAGKTTITNLINRFYEIGSGTITYDGINIKNINKSSLRRSLGMVLQDTNLFSGTIEYNIKYGDLNKSIEDVIDSAKKAQAHNFISILKDAYNTNISGGDLNISQGQAQLLSIARTELYNPPVLILDEATSSIDSRTEMLVQKSMNNLTEGRTSFVIAHRLSTVRDADKIIVLSNGEIIEEGSHEDLLAQKGTYYKLYNGSNLE